MDEKINIIEGGFTPGLLKDPEDLRDRKFEDIAVGSPIMTEDDWTRGYDIERVLNVKIPMKNQFSSLSCVGQAWSFDSAAKHAFRTGTYSIESAKTIYSKIRLPGGAAYFRDGAKFLVDVGNLLESIVPSYKPGTTFTDEEWMSDTSWATPEILSMAETLKAKEYRSINSISMDIFAMAIRDYGGMVAGVTGENNGTWSSNEPRVTSGSKPTWGHALWFGKYGIDSKGKYISTPNSWGNRNDIDALHQDDWQKIREEWFTNNGRWLFSPWVITPKDNSLIQLPMNVQAFLSSNDLKFIRNQETGAMGQIIAKKLHVATGTDRTALMLLNNHVRENGKSITNADWESLPKVNF